MFAGKQPCPSLVASLSSMRLPRFVFVRSGSPAGASPVIVAPCVDDARVGVKWIVVLRGWPGTTLLTLKRTKAEPGGAAAKVYVGHRFRSGPVRSRQPDPRRLR